MIVAAIFVTPGAGAAAPSVFSAAVTTSIPLNGDGPPNSAAFRIEKFGVSTLDPGIYAEFTALPLFAVLAACYGPGLRAARVDPVTSLRHD